MEVLSKLQFKNFLRIDSYSGPRFHASLPIMENYTIKNRFIYVIKYITLFLPEYSITQITHFINKTSILSLKLRHKILIKFSDIVKIFSWDLITDKCITIQRELREK